jgi:DNA ligase (NAD+)
VTGGVLIERATLHNEDEVNRLQVRSGDKVVVERSGDVIPKIIGISYSVENHDEPICYERTTYKLPNACPVCASPTLKDEGGVFVRCTGRYTCSAQVIERIRYCTYCSSTKCIL